MARVSIIFTHHASNEKRSELMRASIQSIVETAPDAEILVADNGASLEDSQFLLKLTHEGKIARYVRYRKNLHFYYARNDCLSVATGQYIVVSDNDIIYQPGWLEECIKFLDDHPDEKIITSPLKVIYGQLRYNQKTLDGWMLNMRAGSNSWVMRRRDYEILGKFIPSQIAGTHWTTNAVHNGYLTAVMSEPKARDFGKRRSPYRGYDTNKPIDNFDL